MWNVSASGRVTSWAESCKRSTLMRQAPVAQGIERVPPEHEVAGSIPAGRIRPRTVEPTWLNDAGSDLPSETVWARETRRRREPTSWRPARVAYRDDSMPGGRPH